jgi:hypothetical protein
MTFLLPIQRLSAARYSTTPKKHLQTKRKPVLNFNINHVLSKERSDREIFRLIE